MINITYISIIPYSLLEYAYVLLENKHDVIRVLFELSDDIYLVIYNTSFGGIRPFKRVYELGKKVDPPPYQSFIHSIHCKVVTPIHKPLSG